MIQCPLCGSSNTEKIESIQVSLLVDTWQKSFKIDVSNEFRELPQFDYCQCADCCLRFFTPESLAGSPALYERLEDFDWYYMPRKWEHEAALEDLRGCERILEIGCGAGGFLALARERLALEVEGLEQNPKAAREAAQHGLHVRTMRVEEIVEVCGAKYDAICSFQVLEHVPNPATFLKACCALLRPGGRLLLGLPNADSFIRYAFNPLDMPPHHMSRWPLRTLSLLPKFFPLNLNRVLLEPLAEYHIDFYLSTYAHRVTHGSLKFLGHPGVISRLARLMRLGARRFCRGATVYVSYVRE
jgi:2-polyprenyl-3-methyl-5-hydroxy-6-metoxy-1,4-benzoquinol methylase